MIVSTLNQGMVGNGMLLYANDKSHAVWQELDEPLIGRFKIMLAKFKSVNTTVLFKSSIS